MPNEQGGVLPLAVRYDGSRPVAGHGYQIHVGPMLAGSRGSVRIRSADPRTRPALRFDYLSTERDRADWLAAVHAARAILSQPAFADLDDGEISPGPTVQSDAEILDWVARDAETALHPSCTRRMGTGTDGVTDPASLRVHGIEGLRVIDASVMPSITNGNIYAPVMMIAEKRRGSRARQHAAGARPGSVPPRRRSRRRVAPASGHAAPRAAGRLRPGWLLARAARGEAQPALRCEAAHRPGRPPRVVWAKPQRDEVAMHVYSRVVFGKGAKVTDRYRSGHKAKDYVPKTDDPRTVFAVEGGTVSSLLSGQAPGAEIANFVAVRAVSGTVTCYAHVNPSVIAGKTVRVGDKIGRCDMSGASSGYHVHLVRIPNSSGSEDDVLDGDVQETAVNFKCQGEV